MRYFSEREHGELPKTNLEISSTVWGGISSLVQMRIDDTSFGEAFPERCGDVPSVCCGMDIRLFKATLRAEIPALAIEEPVRRAPPLMGEPVRRFLAVDQPETTTALDLIEFCWAYVSKPTQLGFHSFDRHHHWSFDKSAGQVDFRESVNRIFRRNGVAFTLNENGRIERVLPEVIDNELRQAVFRTGDTVLDGLLESARQKFLAPDENEHRDALEKIWDAWERIKTIDEADKKAGIRNVLDETAGQNQPKFRELLEQEAGSLTKAGNSLGIRHSETTQESLDASAHVDYMFHRMFSLINLILTVRENVRHDNPRTPPRGS